MKHLFEIHPQIGYLNTNFKLWSIDKDCSVRFKVIPDGYYLDVPLSSTSLDCKFSSGEHKIAAVDLNNKVLDERTIHVKDSIKVGGSQVSSRFVMKDWVTIVMKDRTYFYNIASKREFVEYGIHPEKVSQISKDILRFDENEVSSLYSMVEMRPLVEISQSNIVKCGADGILYQLSEDENLNNLKLVFFDWYKVRKEIAYDHYCYDKQTNILYTYTEATKCFERIDLSTQHLESEMCKTQFDASFVTFIDSHYSLLHNEKEQCIYIVDNDNLLTVYTYDLGIICDYYNKDSKDLKFQFTKTIIPSANHTCKIQLFSDISMRFLKIMNNVVVVQFFHKKSIYSFSINTFLAFSSNPTNFIDLGNKKLCYYDDNKLVLQGHEEDYKVLSIIKINEQKITNIKRAELIQTPNSLFYIEDLDSSKHTSRLCNLDGDAIIQDIAIKMDIIRFMQYGLINIGDKYYYVTEKSIIETNINDISYNPLVKVNKKIYFFKENVLKPLPSGVKYVTGDETHVLYKNANGWYLLHWVDENMYITEEIFKQFDYQCFTEAIFYNDSDHLLCKDSQKKHYIYNLTSGELIEFEFDTSVVRSYNANQLLVQDNQKRQVVFKDPITLKTIPTEFLNRYRYFSIDGKYSITCSHGISLLRSRKDEETKIDHIYLIVFNHELNEEFEIEVGCGIVYVNYITFSYDSKYLAIVGATSCSGYVQIYDLLNEKTIFQYPSLDKEKYLDTSGTPFISGAVWMASFNKEGDLAVYNSSPSTFIFRRDKDYRKIETIRNRNFLCYSPSGNYMALSTQGYHAYAYGTCSNWGHQNSTNVYIRKNDNITQEAKNVENVGNASIRRTRYDNIGAIAFSSDEKRLLIVAEDGTLIVRNLDLEHLFD